MVGRVVFFWNGFLAGAISGFSGSVVPILSSIDLTKPLRVALHGRSRKCRGSATSAISLHQEPWAQNLSLLKSAKTPHIHKSFHKSHERATGCANIGIGINNALLLIRIVPFVSPYA